jgi:hypothetical protein
MKLEWNEVEDAAKSAFNVWWGQPELAWARKAWDILAAKGMTEYEDELERHVVAFRLLILGGIYRDFCAVAKEETTDRWYFSWDDSLDLNPLVMGQLYGRETEEPLLGDDPETDGFTILCLLVERERNGVVGALRSGFGDEIKLYESLARSCDADNTTEEDEADGNTNSVWDVTPGNSAGYEWVAGGCHPFMNE